MVANTQGKAIIQAVGLTKIFRDFWNRPKAKAVNDIDFEIYPGEIVGLLGPNGSGKSTTVKMLLGLLYPSAGSLKIFGSNPRDVETKKRIGYLPEESYLYKYLNAMETLDFFGALFNMSGPERKHRTEQLLEMVGLNHAKRRPVGEFSKGMQRRIGLAQAMINDPDLLVLDEPTSGLDPLGCKEVKELIMLMKKRGKTVLVTSHLLSDVEDICDRVIILYGGKVRATGTLDDLLTIPEESRITTPMLKPEVTERVVKILRENLQGEEFSIDHPRMTLEDFFLDVIDRAMKESIETAGVVSGGKIADYLTEDSKDGKQVLEELTAAKAEEKQKAEDEEKARAEAEKRKEEEAKVKARDVKLDVLAGKEEKPEEKAEPESGEAAPSEPADAKQQELKQASKKLEHLLGGNKEE